MRRTARTIRPEPTRVRPFRRATRALVADVVPNGNGREFRQAADMIGDAVDTAYRVFDEYMKWGREYAQGRPGRRDGEPMTDKATNPMDAAVQAWMDLTRAWMGPFMSAMGAAANMPRPDAWDFGGPDRSPPRGATPPTVSLDVSAQQPTRVKVELHPGVTADRLTIQSLRPLDNETAPPLDAVELATTDGGITISIVVPRDQPAGSYAGLLVDREKRTAAGTVTIVVDAAR